MAYSYVTYTGSGSNPNFTLPFPYLNLADVSVFVDDASVPFTWLGAATVHCSVPPLLGSKVQVRRITQKDNAPVNFTDGSVLLERDLDLLATYSLYVAQEISDRSNDALAPDYAGRYHANGNRLSDLADPIQQQDAVTKNWAETAMSSQIAQGNVTLTAVQLLHSQLHSITTSMERLPYGTLGDVQFNATTGELVFSLSEGPQGLEGPRGLQGPLGATGPVGGEGPRGPQGVTGETGATGSSGPVGPQGVTGIQGQKGDQGLTGLTGALGPEGQMGFQGPLGATGPTGPIGPQGVQGDIGPIGPLGFQGEVGPTGSQGPIGNMGATPLGFAFGHFYVDEEGVLTAEYYGNGNTNDFSIDINGYLNVTV